MNRKIKVQKEIISKKGAKEKRAFTIVEIGIVLVIMSILMGAVIGAKKLIYNTRIAAARTATSQSPVPKISNLIAWYETTLPNSFTDAEMIDNYELTKWKNVSEINLSNSNDLQRVATSDVSMKINAINHAPSVYFNGNGNFTLTSYFQKSLREATIFIVFRPSENLVATYKTLIDSNDGKARISINSNSVQVTNQFSANTSISSNVPNFSQKTDYILCVNINKNISRVFLNDPEVIVGGSDINVGYNSFNGLVVGTDSMGNNGLRMTVSEIIIYSKILLKNERQEIFSYLKSKYRID